MNEEVALELGQQTLLLALKISLPLMCVGLVIGVSISILQAVTQIQEMTLTFVPKMIAMIFSAMFFMSWIMTSVLDFARMMFQTVP